MKNKYIDIISQTFDFPQEEFRVEDNCLLFNDIPIMDVIEEYGTPLKISYLPKITAKIQKAQTLFQNAFYRFNYKASYNYCYCTKSSHFSFIIEEVLKNDAHLETSSAFDVDIIKKLYKRKKLTKDIFIICNGFKMATYAQKIADLINQGFVNTIPILDNPNELPYYLKHAKKKFKLGIRIATDEKPNFEFYTSRLGFRYNNIVEYYKDNIKNNPLIEMKMLHFFINSGIQDTAYYWSELRKAAQVYCELKKICPDIDSLNIGGGMPFKYSLRFEYDYQYMIEEIVLQIKTMCEQHGVPEPNIFTEFGSYTVSESGAIIYSVVDQKQQNDKEIWSMIDSSFLTTLPDLWALNQKFILLAINNWDKEYEKTNLGGLTCDSQDFYNASLHVNQVFLPKFNRRSPQYVGLFHTGAYQESVGGYGGVQHCLTPAPKHVIITENDKGEILTKLFADEQKPDSMLKILGY